jgi:eukaryotic-like serine/threonine-protein kinase
LSKSSQQDWQRLGKYELRERLGRGGMAEVWKAFDPQLERYIAIKLLHADLQADPEFNTRFTREARVIASLHHPNIVQIHDFQISHPPESHAPTAYMVMEYIEGQTLAHYIRSTSREGKFPPPIDIVHLFTSISKAVDYAHQQGMIHRDIKPANILLDKRNTALNPMGEPVLTDFGIAKLLGATSGTMSGMWLGTPLYISPEQAQGYPGNERSDIYALGVILYEVCTGVQPFYGESVAAIVVQHINTMPTPPALINPNIPPALAMVILRAMAKDPAARFSSASALTASLAEAFNVPVPAELSLPASPSNYMFEPTSLSSFRPDMYPPGMLSSPPIAQAMSPMPQPPVALTTPQLAASADSGPGSPATPINSAPAGSSPVTAARNAQGTFPMHLSPNTPFPTPPSTSTPWRTRKGLFIALFVLLFLLAGLSIGVLYVFPAKQSSSATTAAPVIGDVFFLSSGQLNGQNSQGIEDEVQIDLHNIPNPTAGKSYYAWLLPDENLSEAKPTISLGTLRVNQGTVHLLYTNPQHTNLLSFASRFLVTEEDSTAQPISPSPNTSTWHFYSELPQTTIPGQKLQFSLLDHLRHLLASSPDLEVRQLHGGLTIWLQRNTEKIMEWGVNARDDWNVPDPGLIHRQLIHILDYIDGKDYVLKDVPGARVLVNPYDAQVALVGLPPDGTDPAGYSFDGEVPPGYVYLITSHLDTAMLSSQATPEQRQLAAQIDKALNQVRSNLEEVRQDAKQLVSLNNTQLEQPQVLSVLNDLATASQNAYEGSSDPSTGQFRGGAAWIYSNMQRLATFEVRPYTLK